MSKLLGIDYGRKYYGLAISDEEKRQAFQFNTIQNTDIQNAIRKIIQEESIEQIVIGLPLTLSGEIGSKAKEVQSFGKKLEDAVKIPVQYEDERFTTKISGRFKKGRNNKKTFQDISDHQVAAQEILQGYLDKL